MRKFIGYTIVFVLGFLACAAILRWYDSPGRTGLGSFASIGNRPLPASSKAGDNQVANAASKVEKYVVNIDTVGRAPSGNGFGFPDIFGFGTPRDVVPPKGQGSGVIIRPDGYILTNNHVIANTSKIQVTLWNSKKYPATIVGRDAKTDLAVIKINANNLPSAVPTDSDKLKVGDWVIAVGNSLGLGTTVTVGVVSATERENLSIEGTVLEKAIQTDAAINRGNSGGALADVNGNLVGINTAIASTNPGGGSIGIGFAIPVNKAVEVADSLIKHGKVIRPWIGIMYMEWNDEVRRELAANERGLPRVNGALIREVMPGSPADRAGLMSLDVITEINGKKVTKSSVIADAVNRTRVGGIIDLVVWHARTQKTTKVAIRTTEMPKDL